MKKLIQLIPSHHVRDAAGVEVLTIQRLMQEAGWQTAVYADEFDDELKGHTLPMNRLRQKDVDGAIVLYHFCGGTDMTLRFAELECRHVVLYHNITPGIFFEKYDPPLANACDIGRDQLRILADVSDLAIAHSEFSRKELLSYGFDVTRTIPFIVDHQRLDTDIDQEMVARLQDGPPVILFVGRLVPNKAPDHLVHVAAAYARGSYPPVRFVQVGKHHILPQYTREVFDLIEQSALSEESLLMLGEVSDAELMACYRSASLFLSLSRHEGFCVPLIEAMRFGVPVAALRRTAVPETLGEAGILFDSEDPEIIARIIGKAMADQQYREVLQQRGYERLKRYDVPRWSFVLRVLLEQLI